MRGNKLWIVFGLLAAAVIVGIITQRTPENATQKTPAANQATAPSQSPESGIGEVAKEASQIPAHYEVPPAATEMRPVLPASQFSGKIREAYEAARQAPSLLAQMPCYCHCDRGMGHKSLHSCFEDEHAAHCATCVDEALLAYRLQKEGRSAVQIRRQIIAQFGD